MTARSRLMLPLWCWPLAFLLLPGSRQPVSAGEPRAAGACIKPSYVLLFYIYTETWTINITPAVEPKIYTIPLQTNVQLSAVKAGCPGLAWWVEFKNSTYQGFDLAPDEAVYARAYAYYAYRVEDGASTLSKLFVNNSGSGRNVSEDIVAVSCTDHSFVVVLRYYVERPPDPLSSLLSSEVSVPGTASGRPTASSQVPTAPTSCACALPSVTTCKRRIKLIKAMHGFAV